MTTAQITAELAALSPRSAWGRAVKTYALEILKDLPPDTPPTSADLINGVAEWEKWLDCQARAIPQAAALILRYHDDTESVAESYRENVANQVDYHYQSALRFIREKTGKNPLEAYGYVDENDYIDLADSLGWKPPSDTPPTSADLINGVADDTDS